MVMVIDKSCSLSCNLVYWLCANTSNLGRLNNEFLIYLLLLITNAIKLLHFNVFLNNIILYVMFGYLLKRLIVENMKIRENFW